MSVPHPPSRSSEIVIDLDSEPEPESEPAGRRVRIPNAILASIAALVALVAGTTLAWQWLSAGAPLAEETVRSYLEAARAGEVETALALTSHPDEMSPTLVPEALDSRWEIRQVAQVEYSEHDEGAAEAVVYAEIEAFDGTRLGHRFEVLVHDGRGVIVHGLNHSGFDTGTLGRLEINGHTVDDVGPTALLLLPGVYEFYETAPATLSVPMPSVLVLGGQVIELGGGYTSESISVMPLPNVTDEGHEVLAERLREHFDACAERPQAGNCSFAPPEDSEGRIAIAEDAEWTITTYPLAVTTPWPYGQDGFELSTVAPGEVEVSATVTGPEGDARETTLSCPIWVEGFHALFDFDGGVTLTSPLGVDETCRSMVEVE